MKNFSLLFIGVSLILSACAGIRPLIINWPKVEVQTNLPLSRQGVVVLNTIPDILLTIKKEGYFGTSIVVRDLPEGESFRIPADPLIQSQTLVIVISAYSIVNSERVYLGSRSRRFSFNNSGWDSRVTYWDVGKSDLRLR
ncbi:MAG TPA: hypothetical protein ENH86_01455 [Candidatus Jorgensenbacteria bacterium]|nr:hypothetical protein [Candidatus Jorgensenbacteria bacterium]